MNNKINIRRRPKRDPEIYRLSSEVDQVSRSVRELFYNMQTREIERNKRAEAIKSAITNIQYALLGALVTYIIVVLEVVK